MPSCLVSAVLNCCAVYYNRSGCKFKANLRQPHLRQIHRLWDLPRRCRSRQRFRSPFARACSWLCMQNVPKPPATPPPAHIVPAKARPGQRALPKEQGRIRADLGRHGTFPMQVPRLAQRHLRRPSLWRFFQVPRMHGSPMHVSVLAGSWGCENEAQPRPLQMLECRRLQGSQETAVNFLLLACCYIWSCRGLAR